ncbi:MAG: tyrosine-type recombinase/integrase [Candidatus Omnitrophica bacterium]|nr:tyrosine-type recombinase/integrase [Candidatus Omnitrophota bacterium]
MFLSQYGKAMARETVLYILRVYSKRMNLGKEITPHSLRHSFATHLLANGADIAIIQNLLGHARVKSTEVYTRVCPSELKKTVHKYHPRGAIKKLRL